MYNYCFTIMSNINGKHNIYSIMDFFVFIQYYVLLMGRVTHFHKYEVSSIGNLSSYSNYCTLMSVIEVIIVTRLKLI